MEGMINASYMGDLLTVGAVGFVAGVLVPFAFKLIGYVVESVIRLPGLVTLQALDKN